MVSAPLFSTAKEGRLLADFCVDEAQMKALGCFCQLYRDLTPGVSFLNEAYSTRWPLIWKSSHRRGTRRLEWTLQLVKNWTGQLFDQGLLDDNAYYYVHCARFFCTAEEPLNLEVNLQRSIQKYSRLEASWEECSAVTKRVYLAVLHDFNQFLGRWRSCQPSPSWAVLESEELLVGWLQNQCQRVECGRNLGTRLRLLRDFMEFLRTRGQISVNPVTVFLAKYPRRGWRGVTLAVGSENPRSALDDLLPRPRFGGPWALQMLSFVELKRSMGAGYEFEESTLRQLDYYLSCVRQPALEPVSPDIVQCWLDSLTGVNAYTLNTKSRVAKDFFDYLIRQGLVHNNPARPRRGKGRRRPARAFIYSKDQLQAILRCARQLLDIPLFAHRGATYEMIFLTLYALGLRVSEACRLSREDVDLNQGLVLVRKSKFYKSRILPVGPKYRAHLASFMALRGTDVAQAPLFQSRTGQRVCRGAIGQIFRGIAADLGLKRQAGERGPCLHSFRHSFAVHRLTRWYREEEDVQAKLPLLSAYLGHVDIASTQVYLEATTEMLDAANRRFEDRFGYVVAGLGELEVTQ